MRTKNRKGELPFRISKLGRWWGKLNKAVLDEEGKSKITAQEAEIDILAVDSKSKKYLFGECKFRNQKTECSDLDHLKEKSSIARKGATVHYALFSKAGFTEGLIEKADEDESVMLFSLADIISETGLTS
jgi:hypothetical protein